MVAVSLKRVTKPLDIYVRVSDVKAAPENSAKRQSSSQTRGTEGKDRGIDETRACRGPTAERGVRSLGLGYRQPGSVV
jgi:hypothetical protein